MTRKLVVVAGTRPEAIKTYSVLRWLERLGVEHVFVWTGQHYDYEMSRVFFEQLDLPEPDVYLEIQRGGDLSSRFAAIVPRLSELIQPGETIVYALGDTASTLAAALAASYNGGFFVHDEAGVRSFDIGMVEEVNRRLADTVARLHLAPSFFAVVNLLAEGVPCSTVIPTGSTLIDAFNDLYPIALHRADDVLSELNVTREYVLVTIHRRENLVAERLRRIVELLHGIASRYDLELLIPIHPHTRRRLSELGLLEKLTGDSRIHVVNPLGYIEFLAVLSHAQFVITDSGGVQQEAFLAGKPLLTFRKTTEWVETVLLGYNRVTDIRPELVYSAVDSVLNEAMKASPPPVYGDGRSGRRVARILSLLIHDEDFYARVDRFWRKFGEGPWLPSRISVKNTGSNEGVENAACFSHEFVLPRCGLSSKAMNVKGLGEPCIGLTQYSLLDEKGLERLKSLVSSVTLRWSAVDELIT